MSSSINFRAHCKNRKECSPTLQKRGKNWYLDFAFEEIVEIIDKKITEQVIIGVDLGLNNACVCSAIKSDGTIIVRQFLKLPREKDCLNHEVNRIKKAQQQGARKMPRLWARAKGLNQKMAVAMCNEMNINTVFVLSKTARNIIVTCLLRTI